MLSVVCDTVVNSQSLKENSPSSAGTWSGGGSDLAAHPRSLELHEDRLRCRLSSSFVAEVWATLFWLGCAVSGSLLALSAAPVFLKRGFRLGLRSSFLGGLFGDPCGPSLLSVPSCSRPVHCRILTSILLTPQAVLTRMSPASFACSHLIHTRRESFTPYIFLVP